MQMDIITSINKLIHFPLAEKEKKRFKYDLTQFHFMAIMPYRQDK